MTVNNPGANAELVNFYIADDSVNAWAFGSGWLNSGLGQEIHTAVWPSTCDTCLGVASYATRANFIGVPGSLSWFSGRGPRFFDGARIVDVAAPGHYDVISPESQTVATAVGAYNGTFGGTSAAAPHVAGLAALLYQWANSATDAYHVGEAIMRSAWQDSFTGTVPNDNWGYGKINAPVAHVYMMHDLGDAPASANSAGANMDAYPGVQANFPTVYNAPVPGPLHWAAGSVAMGPWDSCLGVPATAPSVSAEGEADVLFDEEMVNNILPLASMADLDKPDDGLPFPGPVVPCAPLPLTVNAFLVPAPTQPPPWNRYVNVWFDWNTDGDWGDVHTCAAPNDAPEWALQNWVAGAPGPVIIPFAPLAYQTNPGDPFWIRVSIAEQMPPSDPITLRPDGRGPAGGYAYGETEDYLYPQTSFQAAASTCISGTITFAHDPASSWPVTFAWNFDDGTILTNPGPNPSHQFTQIGSHTVILTGTHTSGVFSVYTQTVQVQSCMAYVPIIRKP
jgi:hypothetical protein